MKATAQNPYSVGFQLSENFLDKILEVSAKKDMDQIHVLKVAAFNFLRQLDHDDLNDVLTSIKNFKNEKLT